MKAVIQNDYSGVAGLQIKNIDEGKASPLSAVIENKYVPVLPYDWMTEYGQLRGMRSVKLPMIIGYGFGGVVSKVGMLRDKHLVGKKVIGANPSGSAQEVINSQLPPLLFEVPDNVALADATTLIGGADAAQHAVDMLRINSNDVVLLTGASGGVGTYVIQLLKLKGVKVIALANEENMDFVKSVGAGITLNYQEDLITQFTGIESPNKVIDTVGNTTLLNTICGYFDTLSILSLSITNFSVSKSNQNFQFSNGSIGIDGYKRLLQLMADNKIHAYIQKIFPYSDVKNAHLVSKNEHSRGRILLEF